MKWLIAPLAAIGLGVVAAVVFFTRKRSTGSRWSRAKDKATGAASTAADQVKSAVGS